MHDPPFMLELQIEQRRAEAKRQLAPRRRKPSTAVPVLGHQVEMGDHG